MAERFESIDVFRGIAVLQMIFWQTFDFFSKVDIYTDEPYYIPYLNMSIHAPGLAFFAFISGVSVYVSVKRKLNNNTKKLDILLHAIKRYGGYILLSLFFTTFVFGFRIFYIWREAIQGIGFAALIAVLLVLTFRSKWIFPSLALIIAFAQPFLRKLLENSFIAQSYPLEPASFNIFSNSVSIFLNSTIRGSFSLTHILPILLGGVTLAIFLIRLHKKQLIKTSFITGLLLFFISIVMHFSYNKIDYYSWSPSYLVGFTGLSFLLFSLVEYLLLKFGKCKVTNFLGLFGKTAIIAYLFHFVVIYKPLEVFNLGNRLNQPMSYILTIISIIIIYYSCKIWLLNKKAFLDKIKQITNNIFIYSKEHK